MRKKTKFLLTAGELKKLLDDVYPDMLVHVSGYGAVQEIEIKNGKLYIRGRHERSKGF